MPPPPEFVSEPITPDAATFNAKAMARGEPGLPAGFTWRGQHYRIAELLPSGKHAEAWTPPGGNQYYRKLFFEARPAPGEQVTLYAVRHTKPGESKRKRW